MQKQGDMKYSESKRSLSEHMRDAAAISQAQRQMQDDGSVCYFFGNTSIRVTETMQDGKLCLKPVVGDQVACGEWLDLPIDRLYGYCTLLERYLSKGGWR